MRATHLGNLGDGTHVRRAEARHSPRTERPMPATDSTPSIQTCARATGLLMLVSMIFGFLGEWYLPGRFILADPAATTHAISTSQQLYRFGFAAYLVEATCDVGLAMLFYV